MRHVGVIVLAFFAVGFAACAVMSAVEGHNVIASVEFDRSRSALNAGVFLNSALALCFAAGAAGLFRSRRKQR
jgi:hypothetical protein